MFAFNHAARRLSRLAAAGIVLLLGVAAASSASSPVALASTISALANPAAGPSAAGSSAGAPGEIPAPVSSAAGQDPAAAPHAPFDTPTALVTGGVDSFTLAPSKIFWHSGVPQCPPQGPGGKAPTDGRSPTDATDEVVRRQGFDGYPPRLVYQQAEGCGQDQILTALLVGDTNLFWLGPGGLMRLSQGANPGDAPHVLNAGFPAPGELAQTSTHVYFLNGTTFAAIKKSDGSSAALPSPAMTSSNLKSDGGYVFYLQNNGDLIRFNPSNNAVTTLTGGVSAYYPDTSRVFFCGIACLHFVYDTFIGKGNHIYYYDENSNILGGSPVYTTDHVNDLNADGYVQQITVDGDYLYVIESEPCTGFCSIYRLYRGPRSGGAKTLLYENSTGYPSSGLTTDGTFLYWYEPSTGNLLRLPNNAAALQLTNLRITGMEVTQGLQDLNNSEPLIAGRNTFVRLYVKSDGADVPGMMAQLSATWNRGGGGPILATSRLESVKDTSSGTSYIQWVGPEITVKGSPNRASLDDSLLFELPYDWTTHGAFTLHAVLNPYEDPLEPDSANDTDNTFQVTIPAPKPAQTLNLSLVSFGYTYNYVSYYPRYQKDILQTISWLQRAYPLAARPAFAGENTPGLYVNWLQLWDQTTLGGLVKGCSSCSNLAASGYVNSFMQGYHWLYNIPDDQPIYSEISDAVGFPRGQESGGSVDASGPAGSGSFGWDFDGSYADWYGGHEIGHILGRSHPTPASGTNSAGKTDATHCGHSASDNSYPYANALIGSSAGSLEGFDPGDVNLGIQAGIYPAASWHDVMSYCNNQWISDYTYWGMYNWMATHTTSRAPGLAGAAPLSSAAPFVKGDFLVVSGNLFTTTQATAEATAQISYIRRLSQYGATPPAIVPGPYSIRLLDGSGATLKDYPFTALLSEENTQPVAYTFNQVVTFAAGTRKVEIVRLHDGAVLASQAVAANPPVISNVHLVSPPNPVSGLVTLAWSASDPTNLPLTFDVLYTRNGGASFQPVTLGQAGSSVQFDTALLGGGTASFRVVASDGLNTAQAESPSFTMAGKPPDPRIITPANNLNIHYGMLVNFSGDARDDQDGGVAAANLYWSSQFGSLATGPLFSTSSLPVGVNHITFKATNSLGLSASAQVTVTVDDNLTPPSTPLLSVTPNSFSAHFGASSDAAATDFLHIENSGVGSMTFTVTSSVPWLTLSAADGTAPAKLTVTFNPAGLADNSVFTGQLTITSLGSGFSQTKVVPVGLEIGTVPEQPGGLVTPSAVLYMPYIGR